jgi:leucyl aminopeptidase (aminopeptidase T)
MVEDERVRGSAHIGLGANVRLGGTIESALHIDATMRKPIVFLDSKTIVKDGNLLVD